MIFEAICFCLALLYIFFVSTKKPSGIPPGDWGIPIFGKLPRGKTEMKEMIVEHHKKYGKIFSIKIGSRIFIFLADYKMIKMGLSRNEFSGRPTSFTFSALNYFTGYGLGTSFGHIWQTNRKFALKALGDLGMGKSKIELVVEEEIAKLLSSLTKTVNSPVDVVQSYNVAILNIIWKLVASKRFSLTDRQIRTLIDSSIRMEQIIGGASLLDFLPWLEWLPEFLKNRYLYVEETKSIMESLKKLMNAEIEEHIEVFDKTNIRDYIDMYLLDLEEGGAANEENHFKKDMTNLNASLVNLFMAGSDTTAMMLQWFTLYMCKYPEVQKKIQKYIDDVVGKDKKPSLADRSNLFYLEAVLYELSRIVSLVPNGLLHSTLENTELNGYKIPKGAFVASCIEICHMSPEYFEDPEEFHPERFLDWEGKLDVKKEGYLPFSVGRRSCIGESLAKTELFLFTAAILQKFSVTGAGYEELDLIPNLHNALLNQPKQNFVIFRERCIEDAPIEDAPIAAVPNETVSL